MATATTTGRMTAEEFAEWVVQTGNPDLRYELDRGRVVEMPSPGEVHGLVCAWVVYLLMSYVVRQNRGRVTSNDTGLVVQTDPATVRGPDVMVFDDAVPLQSAASGHIADLPSLIVEVWSPSDRPNAMNLRVTQYLTRGVPLVWLVDPIDETVAVHRPGELPLVLSGTDVLVGYETLPDLAVTVATLFRLPGTPA